MTSVMGLRVDVFDGVDFTIRSLVYIDLVHELDIRFETLSYVCGRWTYYTLLGCLVHGYR